jgi:hypothetical protein
MQWHLCVSCGLQSNNGSGSTRNDPSTIRVHTPSHSLVSCRSSLACKSNALTFLTDSAGAPGSSAAAPYAVTTPRFRSRSACDRHSNHHRSDCQRTFAQTGGTAESVSQRRGLLPLAIFPQLSCRTASVERDADSGQPLDGA